MKEQIKLNFKMTPEEKQEMIDSIGEDTKTSIRLLDYGVNELIENPVITKEKDITIKFRYPLKGTFEFIFHSEKGFDLDLLIRKIIIGYKKIYRNETSINHYGVFGHDISDLYLEGINYEDGKYELSIGS